MALGEPLQTTTLVRLDEPRLSLAAMGIVKAVAHFLESPIIMILHASTALSKGPRSRLSLWRFVLVMIAVCTSVFLFINLQPVYMWVMHVLFAADARTAQTARPAMLLMVLWPGLIAWRRYFQGMMIQAGQGEWLGLASVGRLVAFSMLLGLGFSQDAPGAVVASRALVGGILTEALLAQYFAHRSGATRAPTEQDPALPQSVKDVSAYYFPLASTMLVVWGGRALLVALVARSVDGPVALASWPAAWGFCILLANSTRMVQQIIIAQAERVETALLLRFAGCAGLICSLVLTTLAFTSLGGQVLLGLLGGQTELYDSALPVVRLGCLLPVLVAMQNALQGFCIAASKNWRVQQATLASLSTTLATTASMISLSLPGALCAIVGMMGGLTIEVLLLAFWLRSTAPVAKNES